MRKVLLAIISALALMVFFTAGVARAEGIRVCPPEGDPNPCQSAKDIKAAVDAAPVRGTIYIPSGKYTEPGILINKNLTIRGAGPTRTIVQAAEKPCTTKDRVFKIVGAQVMIEGLTVRNGCVTKLRADENGLAGGGIWASGALRLKNVIVRDNWTKLVTSGGEYTPMGGGIFNGGSLQIESSTVVTNYVLAAGAVGNAFGAGLYNNGRLEITNSTFAYNQASGTTDGVNRFEGGAIYNAGDMAMAFSTVVNNTALQTGGGVRSTGTMRLDNNLIVYNVSIDGTSSDCSVNSSRSQAKQDGATPNAKACDTPRPDDTALDPVEEELLPPIFRVIPGSSAIDYSGCVPSPLALAHDQLGAPRIQGASCDLGAVEYSNSFLPLVRALPNLPDLEVTSITVSPPQGQITTDSRVILYVTVKNSGNAPVMEPVWVNLYINPIRPPSNQAGATWRALCRSAGCRQDRGIMFTTPASLPFDPNTNTFTLSSEMRQDNTFVYRQLTNWDERLPEGQVEIWAYVDSYSPDEGPTGLVLERNESNNMNGPFKLTVKRGFLAAADEAPTFPEAPFEAPPAGQTAAPQP